MFFILHMEYEFPDISVSNGQGLFGGEIKKSFHETIIIFTSRMGEIFKLHILL